MNEPTKKAASDVKAASDIPTGKAASDAQEITLGRAGIAGFVLGFDLLDLNLDSRDWRFLQDEVMRLPHVRAYEGPYLDGRCAVSFACVDGDAWLLQIGEAIAALNKILARRARPAG